MVALDQSSVQLKFVKQKSPKLGWKLLFFHTQYLIDVTWIRSCKANQIPACSAEACFDGKPQSLSDWTGVSDILL